MNTIALNSSDPLLHEVRNELEAFDAHVTPNMMITKGALERYHASGVVEIGREEGIGGDEVTNGETRYASKLRGGKAPKDLALFLGPPVFAQTGRAATAGAPNVDARFDVEANLASGRMIESVERVPNAPSFDRLFIWERDRDIVLEGWREWEERLCERREDGL